MILQKKHFLEIWEKSEAVVIQWTISIEIHFVKKQKMKSIKEYK